MYLDSQVAGNNRPLYPKVDHSWLEVALQVGLKPKPTPKHKKRLSFRPLGFSGSAFRVSGFYGPELKGLGSTGFLWSL